MANTINLANVNITIQEFQSISDGEYNAGEVKLTSATTLGKMNHHLTFRGSNDKTISHAEILAIKDAFVRALSQNGVDANEINHVRKELGLAPANPSDTALSARSIRPLTRQQVRRILDRYADTINAHAGAGTIRSHAEIYTRYDNAGRDELARTRREIYAEMMRQRTLTPDRRISDIQAVIGGGVHFATGAERDRLIAAADRMKTHILRRSHNNPSNEPNATIDYQQRSTGLNVTFSLGMSEADCIKKLDDMLAMLRGERQPNEATLAVRSEFRIALAAGQESAMRWLNALPHDPQGAFKARTIAVGLLYDGGIDDWATLSLVNRISDDAAIALVAQLASRAAAGEMLNGDALRQSPEVAALAGQVVQQPIPNERQAYIPALSPREANRNACEGLDSNGNIPRKELLLTHEMKTLREGIMAEMRARYGAGLLGPRIRFSSLIQTSDIETAFGMNEGGDGDVRKTAANVRPALVAEIEREMAKRYLMEVVRPILQATGNEQESISLATRLLVRHPELKAQLVAAQSPDEAMAIVEDFRPQIDAGVRRLITCKRCAEEAKVRYREAIATELGIPVESLQGRALDVTFLSGKCDALTFDIESGENPADTDQEIEQAYSAIANRVAEERIALLRQVDGLAVGAETRYTLKSQILVLRKVSGFNLTAFKTTADQISIKNLITALSTPASTQDIVREMSQIGNAAVNAAIAFYNAQGVFGGLGADELGSVNSILLTLALDREPGALELMRAFFARPDVAGSYLVNIEGGNAPRSVSFEMFRPNQPTGEANAALADSIGQPNMAPINALALRLAFDDMGLCNLSAAEKANLLNGAVGTAIANQVRGSNQPVTPMLLRAFAQSALVETAANAAVKVLLPAFADLYGIEVSAESLDKARGIVLSHEPGLLQKIKTALFRAATVGADPVAAVDRLLLSRHDEIATVLRALHEVEAVDAAARETAVAQIAERTNLDIADVRARLNVKELVIETDGSLKTYRDTVVAELSNPATDLAAYNMDALRQNANAKIDEFVAKKVDTIMQIDAMQSPDATKGSLIALVLERPYFGDHELVEAARNILARPEVVAALELARNTFTAAKVAAIPKADLFQVVTAIAKCFNTAIADGVPEAKRNSMGADGHKVLRTILGAALTGHCGATLIGALESLASKDAGLKVFHILNNRTNEPAVVKDMVASIADAFIEALDDEWLPADFANAIHSEENPPTEAQKDKAYALVCKAPGLVAQYSNGLDENQRAELKAFAMTLEYRNFKIDAAESAIRAKAVSFALDDAGFDVENSAAAAKALEMGYNRGELATLQRVADLYREATGCTVREAQIAALDSYSPARQLFTYGGRFVASVDNFRQGLALIGKFQTWFEAITAETTKKSDDAYQLPADASLTLLNANTHYFKRDAENAYQKFIFEHLVVDETLPIDVEDPKTLFDMEHNPVTRFFGREYSNAATNTMAQIPPTKRPVVYAVFDLLAPLPDTQAGEIANHQSGGMNVTLIARVMKNFDAISEMLAAGTLTKQSFCERFLTDVPGAAGMSLNQISDAFSQRLNVDVCQARFGGDFNKMLQVQMLTQTSGATLEECTDAIQANGTLPYAPYIASANGAISELGSPQAGRAQCVLDFLRPANPADNVHNTNVLTADQCVFTVVFPDNTTLKSANKAQANATADKLATFCGTVHPEQLNALYFALSQSAASQVNRAFMDRHIATSEHMPLTYTLSKNADTGAITVRYSEPEGFSDPDGVPIRFHWETVIQLNGSSESTAIVVE